MRVQDSPALSPPTQRMVRPGLVAFKAMYDRHGVKVKILGIEREKLHSVICSLPKVSVACRSRKQKSQRPRGKNESQKSHQITILLNRM